MVAQQCILKDLKNIFHQPTGISSGCLSYCPKWYTGGDFLTFAVFPSETTSTQPTYCMPGLLQHVAEARILSIKWTNVSKHILLWPWSHFMIIFPYVFVITAELSASEEYEAVYICFNVFLSPMSSG